MKFYRYFYIILISLTALLSCDNNSKKVSINSDKEFESLFAENEILINELDFNKAIYNIRSLLNYAEIKKDIDKEILTNIQLGTLYEEFGETNHALKYYLVSLNLSKKNSNKKYLRFIYHKIGNIYLENNNLSEADRFFKLSYNYSKLQSNQKNVIEDLMNLGLVKDQLNQMDSAYFYYKKILNIIDVNHLKLYLPNAYKDLGNLYFKQSLFDEAKLLYKKAIDTALVQNNLSDIGEYYFNMGKTYSGLLKYDSAKIFFFKADSVLKKQNNHKLLSECNYWLTKNELLQSSELDAIKYLDNSRAWKDTVIFKKNSEWHNKMHSNFKIEEKEQEIDLLETKNKYQKIIFISISIIVLLLMYILYKTLKNRNKKLKQQKLIVEKEKEIIELEEKQTKVEKLKLEQDLINQKLLQENQENQIRLELEQKNKEILTNAMILSNKNELLTNLGQLASKLKDSNPENKETIKEILSLLKDSVNQESIWDDFKVHFEKVHQNFFTKLKEKHNDLSQNDLRLAAYLKIGLQNKEIANILFISPESVRKRKQRLREKLNLSSQDIIEYLEQL